MTRREEVAKRSITQEIALRPLNTPLPPPRFLIVTKICYQFDMSTKKSCEHRVIIPPRFRVFADISPLARQFSFQRCALIYIMRLL